MGVDLSNPCLIYLLAWIGTVGLMALQLTSNIVDLNASTLWLVGANLASAALLWLYLSAQDKPVRVVVPEAALEQMRGLTTTLLRVWAAGTVLDVLFSGGLPILWAAVGSDKDYTAFGIPSFHGVMNACYLFSTTAVAVDIFLAGRKRWLLLTALVGWPILMLGRGVLLSAIVQVAAVYLVVNPVNLRRLGLLTLVGLANVVLFGVVGSYRGASDALEYLVENHDSGTIFLFLPSGFLWVYVYLTTGINNLAFSIDSVRPAFYPYYSVINLLPSFLRVQLADYQLNATAFDLVDANLNTNSFYSGYVSDFGVVGGALAGLALQLLAARFYLRAKGGNVGMLIGYTVLFECVVFSVFYDMFMLLPYLLQIAMGLYLARAVEAPAEPESAAAAAGT